MPAAPATIHCRSWVAAAAAATSPPTPDRYRSRLNGTTFQTVSYSGLSSIVDTTALAWLDVDVSGPVSTINVVNGPLAADGSQTVEANFNGAAAQVEFANQQTVSVATDGGACTVNVDNTVAATGLNVLGLYGSTFGNTFNMLASTPAGMTTNLYGSSGADRFVFSNGMVLTGNIDGGAGTDTLDSGRLTARRASVTLTGLGNIDGFTGTVAGTLTGSFKEY